ncbi:MAG: hypothetical protein OIF57_08730 [Marinobacterium sp.]|nr:hypothetical protein [Marinobacterium sp.]
MTTPIKTLIAVSLMAKSPVIVRAAYDGQSLALAGVEPVKTSGLFWRKNLIKQVQDAVRSGAEVLVEEMTDHIAQHATQIHLDDVAPGDTRTNLSVAMDWYYSLQEANALKFATSEAEQCRITDSKVDKVMNDKGQRLYRVNWDSIKGAQRSTMLICLAAEGLQLMSLEAIQHIYANLGCADVQADISPADRMRASLEQQKDQVVRDMQIQQGLIDG